MISWPFDSTVTADGEGNPVYSKTYSADVLARILSKYFRNGVFSDRSDNLQVAENTGMNVTVNPGDALMNGRHCYEESERTLAVQAAHATLDRIDTVVLRLDLSIGILTADLFVVQGTAAANPVAPTLTRNASVYELGLADLFITKATTAIPQHRITDTRLDSGRCGVVASVIGDTDTATYYAQIEADLASFQAVQQAAFTAWFETARTTLDGDTAGSLLNLIQRQSPVDLSVTLPAAGWSDQAPYTQTVSVEGVLATDVPLVDAALDADAETALAQLLAYACIGRVQTAEGQIAVTCLEDRPETDLPLRLRVIRGIRADDSSGTAELTASMIVDDDGVSVQDRLDEQASRTEEQASRLDGKANRAAAPVAGHILTVNAQGHPVDAGRFLHDNSNAWYTGRDLKALYGDAATFVTALRTGAPFDLRVGDYWPITLTGTYRDYGAYTCPTGTAYYSDTGLSTAAGTTGQAYEATYVNATYCSITVGGTTYYASTALCLTYYERALSGAVFLLEVGAINPYWRYGDTAITSPHVLLVSRDCMPQRLKMRRENGTWHDAAVNVPWVGCALYATLNDEAYGVLPLVAGTDIGAFLYNGPNNRGMRYRGETKAIGVATATNYEWIDRGKLFLPSEREVRGADVWSEHIYGGAGLSLQWPIFRDSLLHVRKGLGDGGTGTPWPTLSTSAASATQFVCNVDNGLVGGYQAGTSGYSPPLCLLIA